MLDGQFSTTIQQKIADGLAAPPPPLTRRTIYVPAIPGKALAVIGMRRAGKTYFLWQCLVDKLAAGDPRAALLYFNFEDERLAGMQPATCNNCPKPTTGCTPPGATNGG